MIFFNTKGFVAELDGTVYIEDLGANGGGFLVIFDSTTQQSFDNYYPNIVSVEGFFVDWKKDIRWEKQQYDFLFQNIEFEKIGIGRNTNNEEYNVEINVVHDEENNKAFFVTLNNESKEDKDCTYFIDNVHYILHRHNIVEINWNKTKI